MKKFLLIPLFILFYNIGQAQEILSDTMNAYTDRYSLLFLDEYNHGKGAPINLLFEIYATRADTFYIFHQSSYGKPRKTSLVKQKIYDFHSSETLIDSVVVNKTTYNTGGNIIDTIWNTEVVVHTPYADGYWYLYRKGADSLSTHTVWVNLKRSN